MFKTIFKMTRTKAVVDSTGCVVELLLLCLWGCCDYCTVVNLCQVGLFS